MDFAHILERAGVPFVERGDWRTRVRPGTFRPEAVMIHHTASTGFDATLKVVTHGRPDLNGPLCNIFVARGKCYLISAGRANHAGAGSRNVLDWMRKNSPPTDTAAKRGLTDDFTGANGLFVGFEILSPGKPGVTISDADLDVTIRATAAILRNLRHPHASHMIGHAEWTRRKVDPQFGLGGDTHKNMDRLRQKLRTQPGITG